MNEMKIDTETKNAIASEQAHQRKKWGGRQHTAGEWVLILSKLADDARLAWVSEKGEEAALHEVRQIATTAIACMDQLGAPLR